MFCSIIIPTVGRKTLSRAIGSVLTQEFNAESHELIVVNDSGRPLPLADWQDDPRVQVLNTQQHERSFARNTGAAVAQGRYFLFLDDDDWIAPTALQNFWKHSQSSTAAWLYGSTELVNHNSQPIIQLHHKLQGNVFLHVMAGEWIPLQASLIKAEAFWAVGGFNPLISGPEDIDLLRRIALHEDVFEIGSVVAYIVRGHSNSTTDYIQHPEISRWARERILEMPDSFNRMRINANSGYWHGRIVRIYLTSTWWNVGHRRPLAAGSRALHAIAAFLMANFKVLKPQFWRAVTQAYQSDTFRRGITAAQGKNPIHFNRGET